MPWEKQKSLDDAQTDFAAPPADSNGDQGLLRHLSETERVNVDEAPVRWAPRLLRDRHLGFCETERLLVLISILGG